MKKNEIVGQETIYTKESLEKLAADLETALVDRGNSITGSDTIVAQYNTQILDTYAPLSGTGSAAFSARTTEQIRFAVPKTVGNHYQSGSVNVTLKLYTTFTANVSGQGSVTCGDMDGNGFWRSYVVDDTTSTFTAVPENGYEVSELKAVAHDGEVVTGSADDWSVSLAHNKVWTIDATFVQSATKRIVNLIVNGSGTVSGKANGEKLTLPCEKAVLTLTPAEGYAVKSVMLGTEALFHDADGKITLPAVDDSNGDVTQELTVTFAEKTLVLTNNAKTCEYAYGQTAADVIGDKNAFAEQLVKDLVDLDGSFPALGTENVQVEYLAGKNVLQQEQWKLLNYKPGSLELALHEFGKNAAESIRFTANGKTVEATVNFAEKARLDSAVVVAQSLTMTYTPDATMIADVLYADIDRTNSVLPAGLEQGDFAYFYQCNISDILSTTIGTPIPDSIDLPIIGKVEIPKELMNVWVNTEGPATIGEALKNVKITVLGQEISLGDELIKLLNISDDVLNQSITPYAGEARQVKVTWGGNAEYKGSEWIGTITITKVLCTLDAKTVTVTYGDEIPELVTTIPANINKLAIYVGLDTKDLAFVSVQLPNGALYDAVEAMFPNGFTLSDISKVLEIIGQTVDNETLNQILAAIPDQVKNFTVHLGEVPSDVGVYLVGGVTIDPNYETAYDVSILTILPQAGNLKAEFNASVPATVTPSQLGAYDFGGHVVNTDSGETMDSLVPDSLILGTTLDGQLISRTNVADIAALPAGVYTQVLHVDDTNHLVMSAVRVFTILPRDTGAAIHVEDKTITYGDPIPGMVTTDPAGLGHIDICAGMSTALNGYVRLGGEGECFNKIKDQYPNGFKLSEMSGVLEAVGQPNAAAVMQQIQNLLPASVVGDPTIQYVEDPLDAGVYTVIAVLADDTYYPVADLGLLTVRIRDGECLVQFEDNRTFPYNGQPQAPVAKVINGDEHTELAGAKVNYTYSQYTRDVLGVPVYVPCEEKSTDVGEYRVVASWYDPNHYFIYETVDFEIVPAELMVTMDKVTKCVGQDDPEFTYTIDYYNGDAFNVSIDPSRTAGEAVGTYPITADVPSSKNYTVNVVPGTLTIQAHAWGE